MSDNMVTFRTCQGLELRGTLHGLTRNQVAFETYGPEPVLRVSEVLTDFTLRHYDQPIYSAKRSSPIWSKPGPTPFVKRIWTTHGLMVTRCRSAPSRLRPKSASTSSWSSGVRRTEFCRSSKPSWPTHIPSLWISGPGWSRSS